MDRMHKTGRIQSRLQQVTRMHKTGRMQSRLRQVTRMQNRIRKPDRAQHLLPPKQLQREAENRSAWGGKRVRK